MAQERTVGTYEMLWDCDFCGTKGLLGKSQRHCPECGAKQDADKRYFPKEGEEVEIKGHQYEGTDRYCPACNNPQGAAGKNCANCGSPMDGSAEVKKVVEAAPPPKKKSKLWILFVVLGVLVIVGIVIGVKRCNRTKDAGAKVLAHAWEREVPIEIYDDVTEEGWRNEVPSDARNMTCHQAQRSSKKIEDGETCTDKKVDKGDGTFEKKKVCEKKYKSEPVMDDKCRYTVTKWKVMEKKTSKGSGMTLTDPPDLPPTAVAAVPRAKRAGHKKDTFYLQLEVTGADPPKQECDVPEAAWKKHADGAAVTVQVLEKNGKVACDKSF